MKVNFALFTAHIKVKKHEIQSFLNARQQQSFQLKSLSTKKIEKVSKNFLNLMFYEIIAFSVISSSSGFLIQIEKKITEAVFTWVNI
jgi:hypothetical protein